MRNNYLSVLYKHIIQVENKNVGLKVCVCGGGGGGGGGAQTYHYPPSKKGGTCAPPPLPPPPAFYACDYYYIELFIFALGLLALEHIIYTLKKPPHIFTNVK